MEDEYAVHLPDWIPNTIQSRVGITPLQHLLNDAESVQLETSDHNFNVWVRGYWSNRQQNTRIIAEKIAAMRKH